MSSRARSFAGLVSVGAVAAWFLRLLAHSKRAPAEGRWEELRFDREQP